MKRLNDKDQKEKLTYNILKEFAKDKGWIEYRYDDGGCLILTTKKLEKVQKKNIMNGSPVILINMIQNKIYIKNIIPLGWERPRPALDFGGLFFIYNMTSDGDLMGILICDQDADQTTLDINN